MAFFFLNIEYIADIVNMKTSLFLQFKQTQARSIWRHGRVYHPSDPIIWFIGIEAMVSDSLKQSYAMKWMLDFLWWCGEALATEDTQACTLTFKNCFRDVFLQLFRQGVVVLSHLFGWWRGQSSRSGSNNMTESFFCSSHIRCRRDICWSIQSRRWERRKVEFLFQEFFSSSSIPPQGWRACPLLGQSGFDITFPGFQGKAEGGIDLEGEAEALALAGQRLAEGHALWCQGGVHCTWQISSHFSLVLLNHENCWRTKMHAAVFTFSKGAKNECYSFQSMRLQPQLWTILIIMQRGVSSPAYPIGQLKVEAEIAATRQEHKIETIFYPLHIL